MSIELKRGKGVTLTGQNCETVFDEIVVDGTAIGISFMGDNRIVWQIAKRKLPESLRKKAMRLCRERNERGR